ncbi:MAG TPA: hypothetical protein VD902_09250 [Symbiobacteriaceae bacterium]|nr:hypothetical protein [Symbiobacteriaceae bacterium]
MSHVFSTRSFPVLTCDTPVLTVNFPNKGCPGPNDVVLANGAIVDLVQLGCLVGNLCPAVFETTDFILRSSVMPMTPGD